MLSSSPNNFGWKYQFTRIHCVKIHATFGWNRKLWRPILFVLSWIDEFKIFQIIFKNSPARKISVGMIFDKSREPTAIQLFCSDGRFCLIMVLSYTYFDFSISRTRTWNLYLTHSVLNLPPKSKHRKWNARSSKYLPKIQKYLPRHAIRMCNPQ